METGGRQVKVPAPTACMYLPDRSSDPPAFRTREPVVWGGNPQGGDWFRLWSSMREKRAVVPGATLKSREKKQMPSLNSRWLLNT